MFEYRGITSQFDRVFLYSRSPEKKKLNSGEREGCAKCHGMFLLSVYNLFLGKSFPDFSVLSTLLDQMLKANPHLTGSLAGHLSYSF